MTDTMGRVKFATLWLAIGLTIGFVVGVFFSPYGAGLTSVEHEFNEAQSKVFRAFLDTFAVTGGPTKLNETYLLEKTGIKDVKRLNSWLKWMAHRSYVSEPAPKNWEVTAKGLDRYDVLQKEAADRRYNLFIAAALVLLGWFLATITRLVGDRFSSKDVSFASSSLPFAVKLVNNQAGDGDDE